MRFIQGFIENLIPEQYGDIESFHMFLKTDYIWIREIRDLSEGTTVIEVAFNDYNNTGSHSFIEYLASRVFREGILNDSKFRLSYSEKLENRRNKKSKRNKMKWN